MKVVSSSSNIKSYNSICEEKNERGVDKNKLLLNIYSWKKENLSNKIRYRLAYPKIGGPPKKSWSARPICASANNMQAAQGEDWLDEVLVSFPHVEEDETWERLRARAASVLCMPTIVSKVKFRTQRASVVA